MTYQSVAVICWRHEVADRRQGRPWERFRGVTLQADRLPRLQQKALPSSGRVTPEAHDDCRCSTCKGASRVLTQTMEA